MITLHLLGGARLEGKGGRLLGEPVQRHRLALLSLLALAREQRMPREKLLAFLWPEHAPRQARHLLNVAVHVLRKSLGKDVLRSEGDDLRLDLSRLRCDVVDFRAALDRGDPAAAADLYAGRFLDGFFLEESRDFDEWQEARASELDRAYATALGTLADASEAAGDLGDAIGHLRRLVRHRPADVPATMRLMQLLEAAGDRAGALAAAEDHARTMTAVFQAEPSPEVDRLARRIREEPEPTLEPLRPVGRPAPPDVQAPATSSVEGPAGPVAAATRRGRRRRGWLAAAAGTSLAAVLIALSIGDHGAAAPSEASVAVLPFQDMSAAGDRAYFSDGLTEEILNALAQTPGLRVAARSSSFQFRDPGVDIREVGRSLDVAAVVEGSVRVDGDLLRVTTQLIDASTGYHIWSDQFDRRMSDVFSVQEEIARAVATQLTAELGRRLPDTLVSTTTDDAAAYQLYLRGRHEWRKRTEEGMWAALQAFQQAVALDPGYAAAYAGLSDAWQLLPDYGGVEAAEGLARAKTAALRAVALDSTLAEAHVALGALLDDYDHDRAGAERAYRRAIALNPGYATARHWLGIHLANGGRFEEALEQIEQARRLDPLSGIVNTAVGAVRYFARDYEGAIAEYRAVLDLDPDFAIALALLGRVQLVAGQLDEAVASLEQAVALSEGDPSYRAVHAAALAAAGRGVEARAIADELRSAHPDGYVPYCELAAAYLALGDDATALELFGHAFEGRDPALKHIRVEPLYDRIRADPEFAAFVRRAGFRDS